MRKFLKFFALSKRQQIVASVAILSLGVFSSEYLSGTFFIVFCFALSILTVLLLFFFLKRDIRGTFYYPILILPFFFTLAFSLFYLLIPSRFITRILLISVYTFGLYSLFLTQNIFAVSTIRTINLLRSARIVSFIVTIVVFFLITNIVFSLRLPLYIAPLIVFTVSFLLNFQSLWFYTLNKSMIKELGLLSFLISVCIAELSLVLNLWPVNVAIYSIFLTGIFYAYSGLAHAWIEKRLFKGVFFEYIWVGALAVLILILFTKWGA